MSKTTETNAPIVDWEEIQAMAKKLNLECEQGTIPEHLAKLAEFYEYDTHDIFTYGDIQGEHLIGVVVTYKKTDVDNGVYVFHVSQTGRVLLSVLHPSTIDRQKIVNRAVLDIETKLDDISLPVLTPDDIVRITYEILKRCVCDMSAKEQQMPDNTKESYSRIYMDLLLKNLYMYHTQNDKYSENVVNDQPNRIRTSLLHPELVIELEEKVKKDVNQHKQEQEKPVNGTLPC